MPAALTGNVSEQLGREQLVAVVGEEGVHRPLGDQVTAPARRVQLLIGGMALGAHVRESARWQPPARLTGSTKPRPFTRLLQCHHAAVPPRGGELRWAR